MKDHRVDVLLLEDVPADAALIERELLRSGMAFNLACVQDRAGFLQSLAGHPPDVILADYALPQFSAIEALRLLHQLHNDVPLILVTGSQSEEVAVECMREGAEDYILKSNLWRLPPAIQRALKKQKSERERHAAITAQQRTEEQFRLIAENTRDLICLVDLELNFLYVSPSHRPVLGHDPQALTGTNMRDLVHLNDLKLLLEAVDEAQFLKTTRQTELQFRTAKGQWLVFESAVSHILDEKDMVRRTLLVSRDMSERKRAEKEIRKLAAFPRFNPNPVLEFSADGTLTYFNDAAAEMARRLNKNHPQAILPLNTPAIVRTCLATGQNRLHHETHVSGRSLSWAFFPITGHHVVHCYAEDVTERLNLETQLRQAQKMESVGQLAAGVAHDFNNILTVIQGHAGLLMFDTGLGAEAIESARQIAMASERAANLTRQLLMFSRKQIMQPQLLDLNEAVNSITKMVRSLVGEHIAVKRDLAADLPAIYADHGMLEQVVVNLAVNARDAMPKGGNLTVSTLLMELDRTYCERHPESRPGRFVCLSVSDTGTGMDAATLSRIFEPFFTTKEVGKGTGLGLATVYGIVKQHQGWIEVESEVGAGTTFKIFMPASTKAKPNETSHIRRDVPGGHETILVVEDEAALRDMVQEILQKKGYAVLAAPTGLQALKVWQVHKDRIDLLLTDMMMPEGVSGKDLAEQVLAEKPNLKVIFSSGYSLDVLNTEFVLKEGQTFLQKPYHPDLLVQSVRDCLDGRT